MTVRQSVSRCLVTFIALFWAHGLLSARDYMFKAVPNSELYSDMLSFTETFMQDVKGTPLCREVRKFRTAVRRSHEADTLAWIGETFDFVSSLKEKYPPLPMTVGEPEIGQVIRRDILKLLDFPFHVDEMSPGVSRLQRDSYERARNAYLSYWRINFLRWLESPRPAPGTIQVCKVYSSGYIFRTSGHTLGIDIRWDGTFEESELIARNLDVLLVTHPHDDHMSPMVLQAMTKRGKPVVVPCDNLYSNLILTPSDATVIWKEDHLEPEAVGPVILRAAMGDQGPNTPCLVYYAQMDGWSIVAKGDNAPVQAEEYLAGLPRPDFVIVPVFSYINRILGIISRSPRTASSYLLPCHENEYHHKVKGRVGYRYLYGSPDKSALNCEDYPQGFPYILMDSGESISVTR